MSMTLTTALDKKSIIAYSPLLMSNGIERLKDLLHSQARIARALGITTEQVSRIATGKSPVPEYMDAIAELLEALPRKDWPERWG